MVCSQALSSAVRSIRGHHAPIRALRRRIHTVGGERNRLRPPNPLALMWAARPEMPAAEQHE